MAGISMWQLIIIGIIIIILFGTKKLRGAGSDLGQALKGFKNAIKEKYLELDQPNEEKSRK